mmetsp:Transcript_31655/g.84958  ORF Transcript_31655/g.84958 Transcript_31655/m.84958 type:complete len:213 (+) Transcript_31655:36-674(+)
MSGESGRAPRAGKNCKTAPAGGRPQCAAAGPRACADGARTPQASPGAAGPAHRPRAEGGAGQERWCAGCPRRGMAALVEGGNRLRTAAGVQGQSRSVLFDQCPAADQWLAGSTHQCPSKAELCLSTGAHRNSSRTWVHRAPGKSPGVKYLHFWLLKSQLPVRCSESTSTQRRVSSPTRLRAPQQRKPSWHAFRPSNLTSSPMTSRLCVRPLA